MARDVFGGVFPYLSLVGALAGLSASASDYTPVEIDYVHKPMKCPGPIANTNCFGGAQGTGLKGDLENFHKADVQNISKLSPEDKKEEEMEKVCRGNLQHFFRYADELCPRAGDYAPGSRGEAYDQKSPLRQLKLKASPDNKSEERLAASCDANRALFTDMSRDRKTRKNKRAACTLWEKSVQGKTELTSTAPAQAYDDYEGNKRVTGMTQDLARTLRPTAEQDLGYYAMEQQIEYLLTNASTYDPSILDSDEAMRKKLSELTKGDSCLGDYWTHNTDEFYRFKKRISALRAGLKSQNPTAEKNPGLDQLAAVSQGVVVLEAKAKALMVGWEGNWITPCQSIAYIGTGAKTGITGADPKEELKTLQGKCEDYKYYQEQSKKMLDAYPILRTPVDKISAVKSLNGLHPLYERLGNTSNTEKAKDYAFGLRSLESRGKDNLKDICKRGLADEGQRAMTNNRLLEGYYSCHDLGANEKSCSDRRSMGWVLCYSYTDLQAKKAFKAEDEVATEVAMVAGGVLLTAVSWGALGPEFLGAAELAGAAIGEGTVLHDSYGYLTFDKKKAAVKQNQATMDFQKGWTNYDEFKARYDAAEQESPGSFVARQSFVIAMSMVSEEVVKNRAFSNLGSEGAEELATKFGKLKKLVEKTNMSRETGTLAHELLSDEHEVEVDGQKVHFTKKELATLFEITGSEYKNMLPT